MRTSCLFIGGRRPPLFMLRTCCEGPANVDSKRLASKCTIRPPDSSISWCRPALLRSRGGGSSAFATLPGMDHAAIRPFPANNRRDRGKALPRENCRNGVPCDSPFQIVRATGRCPPCGGTTPRAPGPGGRAGCLVKWGTNRMKGKSARTPHRSNPHRSNVIQRKALAVAIGSLALGFAGSTWGQAVNGTIYGTVPVAPGETIQVTGGAGFNRTITVGPSGRYSITLPVGTYTVSLLQNGKVVQSRTDVSPVAAGAVAVDFSSSAATSNVTTLGAINVTANAIPAIDVSTTNQVTTVTARQLQQLPLQRDAADIAMLAPGVNMGSPQLVSGPVGNPINVFGGASTAENAYYIDGMNVTDALDAQGGLELPYGAIEQQQTFISGYGAKYGRSVGGVINQIGKSGTNEWHFGARALWQPAGWASDMRNYYWANPLWTQPGQTPGNLYLYNKGNHSQETIYDAYVSGPIIKDKLFFFLGAEQDNVSGTTIGSVVSPFAYNYHTHKPKLYAKLNWNINDSNILTLTGLQSSYKI